MVEYTSWIVAFAACSVMVALSMYYVYTKREKLSEMCGMMNGMAYGTLPGLVIGTIYALPTGDYLMGTIIGTIAGLLVGVPLGRISGPLGRMEGVMAGFMGGTMGAMLGFMMRFTNLQLFMQFFIACIALMSFEMAYVAYKETGRKEIPTVSLGLFLVALVAGLASTVMLSYSIAQ